MQLFFNHKHGDIARDLRSVNLGNHSSILCKYARFKCTNCAVFVTFML